jgi:hypothetical protein
MSLDIPPLTISATNREAFTPGPPEFMNRVPIFFAVLSDGRSNQAILSLKVSLFGASQSIGTDRFPHCTLEGYQRKTGSQSSHKIPCSPVEFDLTGAERASVVSSAINSSSDGMVDSKGIAALKI